MHHSYKRKANSLIDDQYVYRQTLKFEGYSDVDKIELFFGRTVA